jgi:hypothetical protein
MLDEKALWPVCTSFEEDTGEPRMCIAAEFILSMRYIL